MTIDRTTGKSNPISTSCDGALARLNQLQGDLQELITKAAMAGDSFDSVERRVWDHVRKMGHSAMELYISAQGTGDLGEQVTLDENRTIKRSPAPVETNLRSIFGEHRFEQFCYSTGSNRKIELRPISSRMKLPENHWSYLLQEFSQMFCVDQAFNQASQNLERVLGSKYSVDTLEQTSRRLGKQAHAFLDALPKPKPESESQYLVASADCKGVPLVKQDANPVAAFETARKRPGNRRMATVASVYTVDPYVRTADQIVESLFRDPKEETTKQKRPRPANKHTMAHFPTQTIDGDEEVSISGIIEATAWLGAQVDARHQAGQPCVLLMDGQHALWEAAEVSIDVEVIEILDIIHVSSYVWEAAALFTSSEEKRKSFTRERLLRILNGEVVGVIRGLRRMGCVKELSDEKAKALERICNYLENNKLRMKYDQYLAAGYPIASGVIEGACAHLVKDRMERSGMRWTLEGARNMLDIRAVFQSTYWAEFCTKRIIELNQRIHPHAGLLADYKPLAIAC